jgi:hypothetical protein
MTQPLSLARERARLFSLSPIIPYFFVALMGGALICLAAVLPLQGIGADDAMLSHGHALFLAPTHILFPGQPIRMILPLTSGTWRSTIPLSWRETGLMFCLMLNVFLLYLLALIVVPRRISLKFILISTFLLGLVCTFIPAITSSDVFSYIAYARIGILYHHNPLTTWPTTIIQDPVITYIYWVNQPSAYGPVWAIITCGMQWVLGLTSPAGLSHMMMALRFWGLMMHLGSTYLIWSISGSLQRHRNGLAEERRLRATLAFAWNPLLLFEACVNAHVDVTLLFFILLAIWVMARREQPSLRVYLAAACLLALAVCIKINVILLAPALFIYLWKVRDRRFWDVLAVAGTFGATIVLLYAPFWDKGHLLDVLRFNPATFRNINSLPELGNRLFDAFTFFNFKTLPYGTATPSEHFTHSVSMILFALTYLVLCLVALRPGRVDTLPKLIGWMAASWLLYCFIGSPWFWPWYLVTFLGLFAILESLHPRSWIYGMFRLPLAARLLTFSSLTLYCFYTWGAIRTTLPGYPTFEISFVRGLWVWIVPLLALQVPWKQLSTGVQKRLLQQHYASLSGR